MLSDQGVQANAAEPQEDVAYMPVGAIVAYAGPDPAALEPAGWMLCDGRTLSAADHPELYAALGTASGGSQDAFQLPQLRGMFVRGTDRGAGRDPNAARRTAAAAGGNTGDAVGSVQGFATGPAEPPMWSDLLSRLPTNEHGGWTDPFRSQADWNSGSREVETSAGGDAETRPFNRSAHYLVKARSTTGAGEPVTLPLGALIPFPGEDSAGLLRNWLRCNGNLNNTAGTLKGLFDVIGYRYGGSDSQFALPDWRGLFLRGVDLGAQVDPGWTERLSLVEDPRPTTPQETLDDVGSLQEYATARPADKPFRTQVPHLPGGGRVKGQMWGTKNAAWSGRTVTLDMSAAGGALETRPINAYLDWYILARLSSAASEG